MAKWDKQEPRVMMSVRVRKEYQQALNDFTAECQTSGLPSLQRYDVLEHLLRHLMTASGRAKIRAQLDEQ